MLNRYREDNFVRRVFFLQQGHGLLLVIMLSFFGCAPTVKESLNENTLTYGLFPSKTIKVDTEASEIRWNEPVPVQEFSPYQLRQDLAEAIEVAINGPLTVVQKDTHYVPARYLLEVSSLKKDSFAFFFPCFITFALYGCPAIGVTANINFWLEVKQRIYRVSTTGTAKFNIYQFSRAYQTQRPEVRAVAIAIRKALQKIAQSVVSEVKEIGQQSKFLLDDIQEFSHLFPSSSDSSDLSYEPSIFVFGEIGGK